MHQFFQSTLLTFTLLNKQRKNRKAPSKRDTNFYFENYCHDDYWRLIWTINSCKGECFKSLRKNERPHNVNSCDKSSCTAGGNGYRNHMFLLYKCLNSLNSIFSAKISVSSSEISASDSCKLCRSASFGSIHTSLLWCLPYLVSLESDSCSTLSYYGS